MRRGGGTHLTEMSTNSGTIRWPWVRRGATSATTVLHPWEVLLLSAAPTLLPIAVSNCVPADLETRSGQTIFVYRDDDKREFETLVDVAKHLRQLRSGRGVDEASVVENLTQKYIIAKRRSGSAASLPVTHHIGTKDDDADPR